MSEELMKVVKFESLDDLMKYISKNWRYIKKEELMDIIDYSYNFGHIVGENQGYKKYSIDDDSYDDGRQEGYNEGYDEGFNSGQIQLNDSEYRRGYDIGHDEGYNRGQDEGHDEGYKEGYDNGYEEGQEG